MRNNHREIRLSEVRNETLSTLKSCLGQATKVILVGFPSYTNPGDSMIWLGTIEYLRMLKIEIVYQCDIGRFEQFFIDEEFPKIPILIQGGGNFGDLWPDFQEFREKILLNNEDRLILQLPQSIYFVHQERSIESNKIISKHQNFILLVRDKESHRRAKELFPSVISKFCPDMAFGLNVKPIEKSIQNQSVAILRQDREKLISIESKLSEIKITDWHLNFVHRLQWIFLRAILISYKRLKFTRIFIKKKHLEMVYHAMAKINFESALDILEQAKIMITDRLHAHVLAVLFNIPHVVCDNSYGKISSIYNDYSGKIANSTLCLDVDNLKMYLEKLKAENL